MYCRKAKLLPQCTSKYSPHSRSSSSALHDPSQWSPHLSAVGFSRLHLSEVSLAQAKSVAAAAAAAALLLLLLLCPTSRPLQSRPAAEAMTQQLSVPVKADSLT